MGCVFNKKKEYQIEEFYEKVHDISEGQYCDVWVGVHKESQQRVCIKQSIYKKYLYKEITNLHYIARHPNIIDIVETHSTDCSIYMIMPTTEYTEDLFCYITQKEGLPVSDYVHIFKQVLSALLHMKRHGMSHGDISPENIVIDRMTMTCKLIDFGDAEVINSIEDWNTFKVRKYRKGKLSYMSPELYWFEAENMFSSDIWSLGVTMVCAATNQSLYYIPDINKDTRYYKLITYGVHILSSYPFIKNMLNENPKERPSLEIVCKCFT